MIYIERTEVDLDKAPLVLWENVLLEGTVTASTEATDADVENLLTDSTFDYWRPTTTSGTVSCSFSSSTAGSVIGIAAHDLGTQGATVTIKRGTTTLATVDPTDDTTILVFFDEVNFGNLVSDTFNLEITGATAAPSIGNLFLGTPLIFETGIVPSYTPLWMAESIELLQNTSLGGQFFQNRIVRKSAETSVNLNILERSEVEGAAFQAFREHYNSGKTFFWAAGPSVFDKDGAYARRTSGGELRPTFGDNGIFYQVSLQMEAYVG